MKYTIITGNALEGFKCYGIFDTELDANDASLDMAALDKACTWDIGPIEVEYSLSAHWPSVREEV